MEVSISRKHNMANMIVFVDGQYGCGKTLFSSIVSSFSRVELLTYAYEIEMVCALRHLNKITHDAAAAQIRLMTDLRLYNTMMGREVNFRPTDLSSVFRNYDPMRYFRRLFQSGDEVIPDIIRQESPILNLTTHNLLSVSDPIWQALGFQCVFIEIIRHPLYMIRQQALNMTNLLGSERDFSIYFEYKDKELPYYIFGLEDDFMQARTSIEKSICIIDHLTKRTKAIKSLIKQKYDAQVLTIPFEPFVLNPEPWMHKISDILQTVPTDNTRRVMFDQNIPRKKVAEGLDLEIYRRCGWVPSKENTSEYEELQIRRQDVANEVSDKALTILDQLCDVYEKNYWHVEKTMKADNTCSS